MMRRSRLSLNKHRIKMVDKIRPKEIKGLKEEETTMKQREVEDHDRLMG